MLKSFRPLLLIALSCLSLLSIQLAGISMAQAADGNYKIGERLSKADGKKSGTGGDNYKEINWDHLMPKDWDPMQSIKNLKLDKLKDGDPQAIEALEKVRAAWDQAPVDKQLDGKKIRIAGFVVPLEKIGNQMTEFLLVPYFGACIHVPPPPANQVIYVTTDKPVTHAGMMDAIWISGELHTDQLTSKMGQSGYRMKAVRVEAYQLPKNDLP